MRRLAILVVGIILPAWVWSATSNTPSSSAPAPRATSGAAVMHAPGPPSAIPGVTGNPSPEPRIDYPSLEVASDSVERMLHRVVSADTALHVTRTRDAFQYWYARGKGSGFRFVVSVRDTFTCPDESFAQLMLRAGWSEAVGYEADGTDGSDKGFVTRSFLCFVQAGWDGGDATDTTYVPAPGCNVAVWCVLRRADDVPR